MVSAARFREFHFDRDGILARPCTLGYRLHASALINGPDNLLLLVFPRRLLSILHSALEQVFSEKLFVWSGIFFEF